MKGQLKSSPYAVIRLEPNLKALVQCLLAQRGAAAGLQSAAPRVSADIASSPRFFSSRSLPEGSEHGPGALVHKLLGQNSSCACRAAHASPGWARWGLAGCRRG